MPAFTPEKIRQRRLHYGQFATPLQLCRHMLSSVIQSPSDRVLDPALGDGLFLREALKQGHRPHNLYGIEADAEINIDLPETTNVYRGSFLESALPYEANFFDVVIGNPPYIRHELLESPLKQQIQLLNASAKLPNTLDMYLWFFVKAWELLKPGGRLCFVSSNSWLYTQGGQQFTQWLARHYRIISLSESTCERWFDDAAIHGVVTILEKRTHVLENPTDDPEHRIQSIQLNTPLNHPRQSTRVRSFPQSVLGQQKLSFWLQSPDFLNPWLAQSPEKWVQLSNIGQVRYPVKTGINAFFYVDAETIARFGIEPEFLIPAVKSSRSVTRYTVSANECPYFLFSCMLSPQELIQQGKTGALNYIQWGETQSAPPRQKRQQATRWPQIASVRNRPHWYQIAPLPTADILCNRFTDKRFFFAQCSAPLIEDQTFYGLTLFNRNDCDFIAALLNSTLGYVLLSLCGQSNLGEGVLQWSLADTANIIIPNPDLYDAGVKEKLVSHWQRMRNRCVLPVEMEIKQADRKELDQLVLSVFNCKTEILHRKLIKTWHESTLTRLQRSKNIIKPVL